MLIAWTPPASACWSDPEFGVARRAHGGEPLARLAPVHRRDGDHRLVRGRALAPQRLGHQVEAAARLHRRDADAAGEAFHDRLVAGEHADIADGAPGHRQRGQAAAAALPRQALHEAVGGHVGALAGIADEGRRRGEQDEVVEAPVPGGGVQVLGADHLRADHRVERRGVDVGDQAVLEHRGGVEHAGELLPALLDPGDQPVHRGAAGDVDGLGLDGHAPRRSSSATIALASSVAAPLRPASTRCLAPRSISQRAASRPKPPRPPVSRWTPSAETVNGLAGVLHDRAGLGRADHDLPDVTRLLHQPERVRGLGRREGLVRQGLEAAVVEQGHHLAEHPRAVVALVLDHLIEVDAEVAEVPPERDAGRYGCWRRSRACPARRSGRRAAAR